MRVSIEINLPTRPPFASPKERGDYIRNALAFAVDVLGDGDDSPRTACFIDVGEVTVEVEE